MANEFTFVLESFQITDTRSLHEDTDYVSFSMVVNPQNGKGTPQTLKKAMGDLNNGTFGVNLSFPNVVLNPTDTVTLNYLIVNSGHKSPSDVESIMEKAGTALLSFGASEIPYLGSALGPLASWLGNELVGFINANCDGVVAAEQDTFTYASLMAKTQGGPFTQTTRHPGTNSPTGCGRNSNYFVTWQMLEVGNPNNKTVPDVVGMATDTPGSNPVHQYAVATIQSAGLRPAFEQGTKGPKVIRQSPPGGFVVSNGSAVTLWRGTVVP